jgi:integrase/recombinase XerD
MSELGRHLENYLRLRRALGFKLEFPGYVLPSLISYLEAAGAATITAELAISWAGLPRGAPACQVRPVRAHQRRNNAIECA